MISELLAFLDSVLNSEKIGATISDLSGAWQIKLQTPEYAAIAAGLAGLLIGLLLMSWRSRRSRSRLNQQWQDEVGSLCEEHQKLIDAHVQRRDELDQEILSLQARLEGMDTTISERKYELDEAHATIKTLQNEVHARTSDLRKSTQSTAAKLSKQREIQLQLRSVLKNRSEEIEKLKQALNQSAGTAGTLPLSDELKASLDKSNGLSVSEYSRSMAERLEALNNERVELQQQSDYFAQREERYSELLKGADDTHYFLDETVILDDDANDATTQLSGEQTAATDMTSPNQTVDLSDNDETTATDNTLDTDKTHTSLVRRIKSSVSRNLDKSKA